MFKMSIDPEEISCNEPRDIALRITNQVAHTFKRIGFRLNISSSIQYLRGSQQINAMSRQVEIDHLGPHESKELHLTLQAKKVGVFQIEAINLSYYEPGRGSSNEPNKLSVSLKVIPAPFTAQPISGSKQYSSKNTSPSTKFKSKTDQRKTILILAANPSDMLPLRWDQEIRDIDEALRRSRQREQFELTQKLAARSQDFQRAMLDYDPNIVHFVGHGTGHRGIALEDDRGQTKFVSGETLARLFSQFPNVECIILNACYTEIQAKAIARHVSYVIGMSNAISDDAAKEFAVAFYDALGAGKSFTEAHQLGCIAIEFSGLPEHLMPILIPKDS